jgi:hypothetical protein
VREAISLITVNSHVTRYFSGHVLGFACPQHSVLSLWVYPFHYLDRVICSLPGVVVDLVVLLAIISLDGMDTVHSGSSFLSRHPIEAAPSGRIWPHSDQEGCIRNLRELPPSALLPNHPSAGPTSPALHSPGRSFRNCGIHNRPVYESGGPSYDVPYPWGPNNKKQKADLFKRQEL